MGMNARLPALGCTLLLAACTGSLSAYSPPKLGAPGPTTTMRFLYTGAQQNFVVPAGVTVVTVTALGAEGAVPFHYVFTPGASPPWSTAGLGAVANATVGVVPGETLAVFVAGQGGTPNVAPAFTPVGAGGFNGGGSGDGSFAGGGGGGGASDVRQGGATLLKRIVVAGGGGGGGASGQDCDTPVELKCSDGGWGGTAGMIGGDGGSSADNGPGGGGATQSAGGSASSGHSAGTFGLGGNGYHLLGGGYFGGAGGGGGYFGGGGGGSINFFAGGGGGGGGSSYAEPSAIFVSFQQGSHAGDGQVIISW